MQVGDLVRFTAPSVFNAAVGRYAASGVITGVTPEGARTALSGTRSKASYTVLWADGRITTEWFNYLELLG